MNKVIRILLMVLYFNKLFDDICVSQEIINIIPLITKRGNRNMLCDRPRKLLFTDKVCYRITVSFEHHDNIWKF